MTLERGIYEEFTLVRGVYSHGDSIHITWPNGLQVIIQAFIYSNFDQDGIFPCFTGCYAKDAIRELERYFAVEKVKL